MALVFLSNIVVRSPLPTDEKYRVDERKDLILITSVPDNYPYLGMVSYVANDAAKNGLYMLKKKPDLSITPSSGLVAADWVKLSTSTYAGLSSDTKPILDTEDVGTFFYETDLSQLLIWDGVAWVTITGGGSSGGFVEVATATALPPVGVANTMYVTVDTNYAYRWDTATTGYMQLGAAPGGAVMISTVKSTLLTSVGGIDPGDEVLIGTDIQGLVEQLIDPFRDPTSTPISLSITAVPSLFEVGETFSKTLTATYSRGVIKSVDDLPHPEIPLTGVKTSTVYAGNGIGAGNGIISYPIAVGSNTWTATVNYAAGTGNYFDSTGASSCIFDDGPCSGTPSGQGSGTRKAGVITKSTNTLKGIYPFLYGASAALLQVAGDALYTDAGIHKLIEEKGDKKVPLTASNQYVYFAYPDITGYGSLTAILDQNGFNVTTTFNDYTVDIDSSGLGVDWTQSYRIYRTKAKTDIAGYKYTFKF